MSTPASGTDRTPGREGNAAGAETRRAARIPTGGRSGGLKAIQIPLLLLAVFYTLALASSLFVPLVLTVLLALVFSPVVDRLERWHVPRLLGAGAVVALLISALVYAVSSSVDPIEEWVAEAPRMLRQLERKVYPIKQTVEEVSRTAEQVDRITSVGEGDAGDDRTVRVQSVSFRDIVYSNAQGLVTGLVMVTFLLYFFLSWGRVLLARVGGLLGDDHQQRRFLVVATTLEVEVSKYLLTITVINLALAGAVAAALYLLGMPNPLLWGAVAGLLNFAPYLGSLVTAVLIGGAAVLAFDSLAHAALVVSVFVALTVLEGQIVTPLVLGRRLALNPLVVFLSVIFWFWLWGVMGALMAVPLLISLKIMGDHIGALQPVARLAGR